MKIILFGKQGSGKGTIGKLIAEKYKIPHIASGDLLREISKENSELGKKVKEIIDQGTFPPNKITIKVTLDKIKDEKGFVLDGYPRNLEQAEALEYVMINLAFLIEISDETAIKRLSTRRTCSDCGEIFNILTRKPKQPGICDKCKGKLSQRDDDKEEVIKKRISLYENETKAIIEMYRKKGILKEVSGKGSPEKVFEEICVTLDKIK